MRSSVLTAMLLAGCLGAALAAAPGASATVECQGVSDCASVAGPWVAVPVRTDPNDYGATYTGFCPPGTNVAGTDWVTAVATHAKYLTIYVDQGSGSPIYGGDSVSFIALNNVNKAESFQPLLGCQSNSTAGASARAAARGPAGTTGQIVGCSIIDPRCAREHRVAVHDLAAGRSFKFTHRCRKGTRLVRASSSVAFWEKAAPSRRELGELKISRKERRGSVTVRVRTGPHVGDNEKVQAQVHTFCA